MAFVGIRVLGVVLILMAQGLWGMDKYLDKTVTLEQVIATKDPKKIRKKVISLWPAGLCSFFITLSESKSGDLKIQVKSGIEGSEKMHKKMEGKENETRKRQAKLLKRYLINDVIRPAVDGTISADDAMITINTLAFDNSIPQVKDHNFGIFGEYDTDVSRGINIIQAVIYNKSPVTIKVGTVADRYYSSVMRPFYYIKHSLVWDSEKIAKYGKSVDGYIKKMNTPVHKPQLASNKFGAQLREKLPFFTAVCTIVGVACWYIYNKSDVTDSDNVDTQSDGQQASTNA